MAKLTSVKTIDMVNGEITKVEYDGEDYEFTDTEEEYGDIALVVNSWGDQEVGEFYNVLADRHLIFDNDSDKYVHIQGKRVNATCYREDVRLYRKASETVRTNIEQVGEKIAETDAKVDALTERVDALEKGATQLKTVKRKARVGERILITNAQTSLGHYENGDILTVGDDDFFGGVKIAGDSEAPYIDHSEYEVIVEESSETITFEGKEYTLVDRKARPGDVVEFTENTSVCFTNGKKYGPVFNMYEALHIRDDDGDYINVYATYYNRTLDTVKVYEPIAESTPEFKEGDRVKALANGQFLDIRAGEIGKVAEVDAGMSDYDSHSIFVRTGAGDTDFFRPQDLEVVSESTAKLAKYGRKPGEFKKGDIVRVESDDEYDGVAGEIEDYFPSQRPFSIGIRDFGGNYRAPNNEADVKLVAPVESRVDLVG